MTDYLPFAKDLAKIRRILYDSSLDGCVASDLLELPPQSEDGRDKEHKLSEQRQRALIPIFEEAVGIADLQARYLIARAAKSGELEREVLLDPSSRTQAFYACFETTFHCVMGALSTLLAEGKIEVRA